MSDRDDRTAASLPVVDPDEYSPGAPDEDRRIVAIVLAAGQGSRFEEGNKLLTDLDGEAIVVRATRTMLSAGLPVVAVLGHEADRVGATLRSLSGEGQLALVGNPDYRAGQATSVRTGVRTVCGADAAVFALGDMPSVDPASVESLLTAYRGGAGDALAAACEGRRGNPVLFDGRHFPTLADVDGDVGGREILLDGDHSTLVETGDAGVLRDVNTVDDLDRV